MKKKITLGLAAFAMVAASAVFMKSIAKDDLSAMIQANVDALTQFEWDGDIWTEDDNDHWFGSNWFPVLADCDITSGGSISIGIPGIIGIECGGSETIHGKEVTCNNGPGNCINGSPCTNS